MSRKPDLRNQREGTIINTRSKPAEGKLKKAINDLMKAIVVNYNIEVTLDSEWKLRTIVSALRKKYPEVEAKCLFDNTSMRPDGGILSIIDKSGVKYPILITEAKNQGTNDIRAEEGKQKQAKGNAIERLGKNVIGFRVAMMHEEIFPFVCFGDGCDFRDDSSILDRVSTIAMFAKLNEVHVHNEGPNKQFNRGSFFFRDEIWTEKEMLPIMEIIAKQSIEYYFEKYGKANFMNYSGCVQ